MARELAITPTVVDRIIERLAAFYTAHPGRTAGQIRVSKTTAQELEPVWLSGEPIPVGSCGHIYVPVVVDGSVDDIAIEAAGLH